MDLLFDKSTGYNLIVVSDVHIGSVGHAEMDDYQELIALDKSEEKIPVVLGGDIIDMANCKKKMVPYYSSCMTRLNEYFGTRYIIGNHESAPIGNGYTAAIIAGRKVLFFHGTGLYIDGKYHGVYYTEKQVKKWETKSWGRGFWSALGYKIYRMFSKHKGGWKEPSEKIKDKLADVTTLIGCDVVVYGHTHREWHGFHKGIEIFNVPKGISYLNI